MIFKPEFHLQEEHSQIYVVCVCTVWLENKQKEGGRRIGQRSWGEITEHLRDHGDKSECHS